MSITKREIHSKEMERATAFVKQMTKSMTFDENMESANWPRMRRRNNLFYSFIPTEKGITFSKVKLGKVDAMLARNKKFVVDDDNVILYLHGGGFVTGSAFVSKSYTSMLAKFSGNNVYAVQYALAPEHKFPAGFSDCCEAFEAVIKLHPYSKITLVGESAGGNLSIALGLKYKDTGKIACVIVHSPTTDLSGAVNHTINDNKDFIVKLGCTEPLRRMYVGDNDVTNPYISPIYGDFAGFPPTFITCDANETLQADAYALYEKCVIAGVDTKMVEVTGAYHAFAVSGTTAPETTKILVENMDFMRKGIYECTQSRTSQR